MKLDNFVFPAAPPENQNQKDLEQNLDKYFVRLRTIINKLFDLSVYANNAAAVAAGLSVGDFYRDSADPSRVCVVY